MCNHKLMTESNGRDFDKSKQLWVFAAAHEIGILSPYIRSSPLTRCESNCDQINSLVKRKAHNIGNIWGVHEREPVKPTRITHKEQQSKVSKNRVVSLRLQVKSSPLMMSKSNQESESQYSYGCIRCQVNIATFCNIWTTLCTLFMKCEEKQIYFRLPLYKDVL